MSDIQAGDIVVCINDGGWEPINHSGDVGPRLGQVLRVESVWDERADPRLADWSGIGLCFALWPDFVFGIEGFRKLNDEPDNAEIVALIRRRKPVTA